MADRNTYSGVRWSGLGEPDHIVPTPEAEAKAQEAYLKALERWEAEIAAYGAQRRAGQRDAA